MCDTFSEAFDNMPCFSKELVEQLLKNPTSMYEDMCSTRETYQGLFPELIMQGTTANISDFISMAGDTPVVTPMAVTFAFKSGDIRKAKLVVERGFEEKGPEQFISMMEAQLTSDLDCYYDNVGNQLGGMAKNGVFDGFNGMFRMVVGLLKIYRQLE